MVAADDVAVRRQQRVASDRHLARREQLAVEADVGPVGDVDIAVLARQDRVPPDEDAAADRDAAITVPLRVDQAVVVDDHVVADPDLVRMSQHHVLPEDHVPSARAQEHRGTGSCAARAPARRGRSARAAARARASPADPSRDAPRRAPNISCAPTARPRTADPAPWGSQTSESLPFTVCSSQRWQLTVNCQLPARSTGRAGYMISPRMPEQHTASAARRRERWIVLAIVLLIVFCRSAIFVFRPESYFDADQGIFGLMAKHLAERRAFPLSMYGQSYILGVEAWMAAPLFAIFGVSAVSY